MDAADALQKVVDDYDHFEKGPKFHLVTDDEATVLVRMDGEWWLIGARRSDEGGHFVRIS